MEDFLATVLPRPADTGGIRWQFAQILFVLPNFVVLRKICFKHMIKKISPPKNVFFPSKPQNLTTGLVLPKLCLQLEYFVLKSIRSRDVA